ncbi:DUF2062 domain-containing protein [Oceanicoccus sagamiensis]|uniref:ATP-binding protein n=1 Tax=Oceanicoccus sagamiensis TaxID=716816 RepID=A0A1X9NPN2_9GAMM|nr:DUF2062 domain-containing protein [Oceanicoccus sagamiensis]ARN75843.1 ATP-binding protein [Oceanicoccus sagamiensis]
MARKIIKRFVPDPDWVKEQQSLKFLGGLLHDPNLWHLNRHSVATATFIGFFVAFVPLPTQMIIAALLAMFLRANLPISVALVWITNPFTMAPIFYAAYKVGIAVTGTEASQFAFELSWEWLLNGLENNWQPFLLGCVICGLSVGLLASGLVRLAWRQHTISRWKERRSQRKAKR